MATKAKQTIEGSITLNGIEYVPASTVANNQPAPKVDGLDYVLIRTYSAGVFTGYLKRRDGKEVELVDARRIWYWSGAASLSQLATDGPSKPASCKFPAAVPSIVLTEAIEIIPVSAKAQAVIAAVPEWKQ
jgi:hypothetical protein